MARERDEKGRFVANNGNGRQVNEEYARAILPLIANANFTLRRRIGSVLGENVDPRRNLNDECGYPETTSLTAEGYRDLYDREGLAVRVVEVLPRECWKSAPTLFETEDNDNVTQFETAWSELGDSLRGDSWYQDSEGNPVWEYLQRLDIISGIGSYGVLLLGVDDGADLAVPLEQRDGAKLLYMRTFDESMADITTYETDLTNPRYGQPVQYLLTFNDPNDDTKGGVGLTTATRKVHWTRVVHVADNLLSSEVFGVPRMQPVYNRLRDLLKLYGGSAEMYYKGAFPGIALETDPALGGDVALDISSLRDQLENYMNGLQRYMALIGVKANSLSPQVVDPSPQIDKQIEAICIRLGIPKRIFMGSERGELASNQDNRTWHDRLRHRQSSYITPRVIIPFVDRLISIGVLPEPEGYSIRWPDLDSLTEAEMADIAMKKTEAMAKYVGGDVESIMVPMDFMTRILEMEKEEAEEIVKAAAEALEEREEEEKEERKEMMQEMQQQQPQLGAGPTEPAQPPQVDAVKAFNDLQANISGGPVSSTATSKT